MFKHRANGKGMAYDPMEYNPNGKDIMTPMEYTLKGDRALFRIHKSRLSLMFFTPLWRTIKNSGRAGNGREDIL